jgi:hypothetical protein
MVRSYKTLAIQVKIKPPTQEVHPAKVQKQMINQTHPLNLLPKLQLPVILT